MKDGFSRMSKQSNDSTDAEKYLDLYDPDFCKFEKMGSKKDKSFKADVPGKKKWKPRQNIVLDTDGF